MSVNLVFLEKLGQYEIGERGGNLKEQQSFQLILYITPRW